MRVMLCYDGSKNSRAGLPLIRQLAEMGAEIDVVQVVVTPPREIVGTAAAVSPMVAFGGASAADLHRIAAERRWRDQESAYQSDLEAALASAHAETESVAAELPGRTQAVVTTTQGDAADVLIEQARANHYDMIVMATNSRSVLRDLVLGSVSRAVLASGVAPVTLVHHT